MCILGCHSPTLNMEIPLLQMQPDTTDNHRQITTTRRMPWKWLLAATLLTTALGGGAAPWIDPGDEQLRHHLEVLADAGIITVPITTYPLMWSGIARDLERHSIQSLNDTQLWSFDYVRHALHRQRSQFVMDSRVGVSTDTPVAGGFAADQRERREGRVVANWLGDSLSVNLAATVASDEIDNRKYRLDGSYIAGIAGNWSLSAGAVNRWWGPGWQDSLILSGNSRPIPGLALQRNYSDAFQSPWLSWIGPWQLVAFAGQLESDRFVPDAKLLGMRITFKPLSNLELGLSRTAQWGGEGRPQTFKAFWDAFTGKDNRGNSGITQENEPGNQLAGFDARLGFGLGSTQLALYSQAIGEDAAGISPSRFLFQAGAEVAWTTSNWSNRLYIEGSDTRAAQGDYPNYAYEHAIYRSGYRYRGRSLAAGFDNDTLSVTVGGYHYMAAGHQWFWKLAKIELNRDNTNAAPPGGNPLSDGEVDMVRADLGYKRRLNRHVQLGLEAFYQSEDIQWRNSGETIGSGAELTIEHKW